MLSYQYVGLCPRALNLGRPVITAEAIMPHDLQGQALKGETASTWLFFGILLICHIISLRLPCPKEGRAIWGRHMYIFWQRAPVEVPANSINCQIHERRHLHPATELPPTSRVFQQRPRPLWSREIHPHCAWSWFLTHRKCERDNETIVLNNLFRTATFRSDSLHYCRCAPLIAAAFLPRVVLNIYHCQGNVSVSDSF